MDFSVLASRATSIRAAVLGLAFYNDFFNLAESTLDGREVVSKIAINVTSFWISQVLLEASN